MKTVTVVCTLLHVGTLYKYIVSLAFWQLFHSKTSGTWLWILFCIAQFAPITHSIPNLAACPEGSSRLVDIPSFSLDRVEVLYNRRWGLVCDSSWSSSDARVVCQEHGRGNEQRSGGNTPGWVSCSAAIRSVQLLSCTCKWPNQSLISYCNACKHVFSV